MGALTTLVLISGGFREELEVGESFDQIMTMLFNTPQSAAEAKASQIFHLEGGAEIYIPAQTIVRVINNAS